MRQRSNENPGTFSDLCNRTHKAQQVEPQIAQEDVTTENMVPGDVDTKESGG